MADDGYDRWLDGLAWTCRNCPACCPSPCDGCQQGGVCDEMACLCDDDADGWDEGEDDDG